MMLMIMMNRIFWSRERLLIYSSDASILSRTLEISVPYDRMLTE